jgi:hypothetical protein
MTYRYHVFVSYKRELLWTPWTRDHLKRLLASYLQQELRQEVRIFFDDLIEIGADYVEELGHNLAQSMVMVAILSGDYFASQWCLHELDLMLYRNAGRPGLIVPIVVHDCENLPDPVSRIQSVDFKDFRITHMNEYGHKYEQFSIAVKDLAPKLARVIRNAPPYQSDWLGTCVSRFQAVYAARESGNSVSPLSFTPPPPISLLIPPRLFP